MSKWTFFGKVLPERFPVTMGTPLEGEIEQPDFGIKAKFRTVIHAGQVIVTLELTSGTTDVFSLRNLAIQCAQQLTDLVGYSHGGRFDVDMVSAVKEDAWWVFGPEIPAVKNRTNSHRKQSLDGDLIAVVGSNPHAAIVLRDFQNAMGDPIGTGFYCYRAVEAMMQSMKSDTIKNDKAAWGELNRCLRLDRSASEYIKAHADYPRHGKPWSMTDNDRATVFALTDQIIERFLEFVRKGSVELPEQDFPPITAPTAGP